MSKASQWVQNSTGVFLITIFLTWGGMALAALAWAMDDAPPIKINHYTVSPAYPGGTMVVVADVERNFSRKCDAVYSRRFVDSRGAIWPAESDTSMGASSIQAMDARNPGKLIFTVPIDYGAAPGLGTIVTPMTYRCNPWHSLRPLSFSLEMQGRVLAP